MSTLLFVLALGGGEASANSYICQLTQSEVEDILEDYQASETFQDVEPFILAPFDCPTYGSLCDMVGASHAPTFVCGRWDEARAGLSMETIRDNGIADLEAMTDAWFDERFPNGIGENHPWFGAVLPVGAPPPPSCPTKASRSHDASDGSSYILKGRAFVTNLGWLFREIGITTKMFKRSPGTSVFLRDYSAWVEVEGDFSSSSPSCSGSKTKDQDDGRVGVNYSGALGTRPFEYVTGQGEGQADDGATISGVQVCIAAGWDDNC